MRIVINRSDAIGDVILTMPMAKMLKSKYPDAEIIFIISPKCEDLFDNHPYIDDVWVLDSKRSFIVKLLYLYKKFSEKNVDMYFHVGGNNLSSFVSWLKNTKFRGGLKSKWQTFFFLNKAVRQKRSMVEMHESEYNLNLLVADNILFNYRDKNSFAPEIHVDRSDAEKDLNNFFDDHNLDKYEVIIVHPGMTGHTLNWSGKSYGKLINRLESEYNNRFVFLISHTPSDEKYLADLRQELEKPEYEGVKDRVVFFNGAEKGLRNYISIVSKSKLFIGPSTGTTHIANTLKVSTLGIYSPIKVQSSLRWGPYYNGEQFTKVIAPDVVCGQQFICAKEACPYYECMSSIEVEEVFDASKRLIELNE